MPSHNVKPLPPSLSPIITNHPASCAYRITLSPHEWTWTQEEQQNMAEAIVLLDKERQELREKITELQKKVS
jgi:hypothetical protein